MASPPDNEPVLSYAPGTPERAELKAEIERQSKTCVEVPLRIGAERRVTAESRPVAAPHRHELVLGAHALAGPGDVAAALGAARAARSGWAARDLESRARIFRKAADLLSGPWRQRLNAATMLNQSKTAYQAEIDAACELCDFFRLNAHFALRLAEEPLRSPAGQHNRLDLRPLDGFVYAVTPFNFTAIAGNLPAAPALLGNTVIWKPSPLAALSAHYVYELLREAGLPDGVINLVQGDAAEISREVIAARDFAGLHFTGSTSVFRGLWAAIGERISSYASYPRVVGECGGKDFIFAHASADVTALAVAVVRGGFEYQGQKCSAASRVYVPRSIARELVEVLGAMIDRIRVGDPADFRNFMGAVIGRAAYDRIRGYQERAKADPSCRVVRGGGGDDSLGFFVEPTLIEVTEPRHALMREEIFGPVVALWVYDDDRLDQALALCDETSDYALTGAVFARDRAAVAEIAARLRFSAGNFYVNDKPTGAVVAQQPFGGSRLSGTNDKAGSAWNLLRWTSPRVIKENQNPPRDFWYPHMQEELGS
jgi:1-pyrroline-5-carboxylate dehydrogenase